MWTWCLRTAWRGQPLLQEVEAVAFLAAVFVAVSSWPGPSLSPADFLAGAVFVPADFLVAAALMAADFLVAAALVAADFLVGADLAAVFVPLFVVAAFVAVAFFVAGVARLVPTGCLVDVVAAVRLAVAPGAAVPFLAAALAVALVRAGAAFVAGVVVAPVLAGAFLGAAMWSSVTGAVHLDKCG